MCFGGVTWEYCCNDARELVEDNEPISLAFAITATPGRGVEVSTEFPGKIHFTLLTGRKYLVHRVTFATRINRIQVLLLCSFQITYSPRSPTEQYQSNGDEVDTKQKQKYVANLVTNAGGTRVCNDDVIRLFVDWLDTYHEAHFAVIREVSENPGSARQDIWAAICNLEVREDSPEADLFKLLFRDLSTGGVVRQERDINQLGQFVTKRPVRVPKGFGTRTMKSAFDDKEAYVLTALGVQFVHYTMNERSGA